MASGGEQDKCSDSTIHRRTHALLQHQRIAGFGWQERWKVVTDSWFSSPLNIVSGTIEDLLSRLADDETLAYFYCAFRNPRCTSTVEFLRSLTAQLLWDSEGDWLPSFSELFVRKQRGAGPPADVGTLSNLIKRAAGLYKRPMIVIDALDAVQIAS
ncbi:hypothetical protein BDN67DRAFT_749201 [Paxillus ammoniavirescens]|nr:hypothetical protein BDN67DRAFT_749201 [Paxillus ammoniavirescens]